MSLLATTTRGLESVAADEIESLTGAETSRHHPGMLAIDAPAEAALTLQRYARTLNRILVVVADEQFEDLAELTDIVAGAGLPEYFDTDRSFAVRAKRHGEHPFESPDVERAGGDAVSDAFADQSGERPAVDLENPDIVVRLFVRHDRVVVTLDVTGQYSLHRRAYRNRDHEAPLRPTTAAALVRVADPMPGDRVVDPCCGCGTIPIEGALLAGETTVRPSHDPLLPNLSIPEHNPAAEPSNSIPSTAAFAARDNDPEAVAATRENAGAAGVGDELTVSRADVTTDSLEADIVVADLPYGIRTESTQLPVLYEGFVKTVSAADPDRIVVLTANPDLLPYDPSQSCTVRRGNLEATLLVVE